MKDDPFFTSFDDSDLVRSVLKMKIIDKPDFKPNRVNKKIFTNRNLPKVHQVNVLDVNGETTDNVFINDLFKPTRDKRSIQLLPQSIRRELEKPAEVIDEKSDEEEDPVNEYSQFQDENDYPEEADDGGNDILYMD